MQTQLADFVKNQVEHDELAGIIRSCVHCGFCNATCPTYQLTGNELDGPRGRIYLLKHMLEGQGVSNLTQHHVDTCLNCRACETTCPSGVKYGRLLEVTRPWLEESVSRSVVQQCLRWLMTRVFPYRGRFAIVLKFARVIKPILPATLKQKIPRQQTLENWPVSHHDRQMVLVSGCVQAELSPRTDVVAAQVLDKLGIRLTSVAGSGCCGALSYHLSAQQQALALAKQTIDACWPYLQQGAEAVVMTASGCGLMLKDYGELLQYDPAYAEKAVYFSARVKDMSEILQNENLSRLPINNSNQLVAFQSPCTLQHGQKLAGVVESILTTLGFTVLPVPDGHLCCGSAGVYSLLQPDFAGQLQSQKLQALESIQADVIVTANIGCQNHLQAASTKIIRHWLELLV